MAPLVPRVYVLGKSPLTGLVTHALAKHPIQPQVPEIVSLLPSEEQLRLFLNRNSTHKLTQYRSPEKFMTSSAQLMSACRPPVYSDGSYASINELVVSLANPNDITGLKTYKKCIRPDTNILLLNSDKAILDSLTSVLWKNPLDRPNIYQCLSDFTVWKNDLFETNVLGEGRLKIAKVPTYFNDADDYNYELGSNIDENGDLIKMVSETSILNPLFMSYSDFALEQAESMIVKTCIGSLTALYDCSNGDLLHMENISQILMNLIKELIRITVKTDDFLVKTSRHSSIALDKRRLLDLVLKVLQNTEKNSSLMRQQIKLWNVSEIHSTLTFFTVEAHKHRVHAPNTMFLRNLLLAKVSNKNLTTLKTSEFNDSEDIEFES